MVPACPLYRGSTVSVEERVVLVNTTVASTLREIIGRGRGRETIIIINKARGAAECFIRSRDRAQVQLFP